MDGGIGGYHAAQEPGLRAVCEGLARALSDGLPGAEARVWHGGPVWFLAGNPIAGYWVRKGGVALLFWSGQSFDLAGQSGAVATGAGLTPEGKFKAAGVRYRDLAEVDVVALRGWLALARVIQWDYKNIVTRRGRLEKLGAW